MEASCVEKYIKYVQQICSINIHCNYFFSEIMAGLSPWNLIHQPLLINSEISVRIIGVINVTHSTAIVQHEKVYECFNSCIGAVANSERICYGALP